MITSPKTSREDLANLGWPIQQVLEKAMKARPGTMDDGGDLYVNDGLSVNYQWWCYNVAKGGITRVADNTQTASQDDTSWSYDNSTNTEPYETEWTEKWTEGVTATVEITNSASINLSEKVEIPEVGGSELSVSISTESKDTQSQEITHSLENTWRLKIEPGEIVSLKRTIVTTTGTSIFTMPYGVNGLIGTNGRKYDNHYHWCYDVNWLLDSPVKLMTFKGTSRDIKFKYTIVRTKPQADQQTLVHSPPPTTSLKKINGGAAQKVTYAVPGHMDANSSVVRSLATARL